MAQIQTNAMRPVGAAAAQAVATAPTAARSAGTDAVSGGAKPHEPRVRERRRATRLRCFFSRHARGTAHGALTSTCVLISASPVRAPTQTVRAGVAFRCPHGVTRSAGGCFQCQRCHHYDMAGE
jgi:hypothetical protein